MYSYESSGGIRRAFVKAWKPVAWLSALALTTGGLLVAAPQQVEAASVDFSKNPYTTTTATPSYGKTDLSLKTPWMPVGSTTDDAIKLLFGSGIKYNIGSDGPSFVGSWTGDPNTGYITNQNAAFVAAYVNEPSDNASRMSALDAENGPTLYIWNNDSQDYWKTAPQHPAEFTDAMLGTMPTDPTQVCRASNWTDPDRGSWISARAFNVGTTTGTVFWVPNPRAADVMSVYKAAHPNYPGTYDIPRDPTWSCGKPLNWDDGWGGGEVIPNTGEIFFTSRQSSKISATFRTMIFDPKTGAFASSGLLQPADPQDDIFEDDKAKVAGDLMVDAYSQGYVIAKGLAPAGSTWADPTMPGAWAAYLLRIVPTPNPNYNENDPNSLPYLHNGQWKYNIIQKLYPAPEDTGSGPGRDLNTAFAPAVCSNGNDCTKMQGLKGSNWYNGQIYTLNNKYMYRINPMTGRVYNVPQSANAAIVGAGADNDVDVRDLASGQGPVTVSGTVFFDKNANGRQDPGEWGIPGMQLILYSDTNNDGVWVQESDTGRHQTSSSGQYTFLLSGPGTYQVRVVQPKFNPDAKDTDPGFETDVHNASSVDAYQTGATSGSADDGHGTNTVTAHCKVQNPTPPYNVLDSDTLGGYGDYLDSKPCSGAQDWPYNDPPPEPFNPANTSPHPYQDLNNTSGGTVAVYSTIKVTVDQASSSRVPNADFGLATPTNYKVAVQSHDGTGSFTIDGQSLNTTQPDVQVTSNPINDVLAGARTSTVTLPDASWTVTKVEILDSNNAVVDTPTYTVNAADKTKGSFTWSLPALPRGYTAKVYVATTPPCDPAMSEMTLTPPHTGDVYANELYTVNVQLYAADGKKCRPTPVTFSDDPKNGATPQWPDGTTCTTNANGTCDTPLKVTSPTPGQADIHAKIPDPVTSALTDVGGGGDPTKASPQTAVWKLCGDPGTSTLVVEPNKENDTPKGLPVGSGTESQYKLTVQERDPNGDLCPAGSAKPVTFSVGPNATSQLAPANPPADQPKPSSTTCTPADANSSCSVTVTSTVQGTFPLHAQIPDENGVLKDVEGKDPVTKIADPAKASPQSRTWHACEPDDPDPTDYKVSLDITPERNPNGSTATADAFVTDKYLNPCVNIPVGPNSPLGFTSTPTTPVPLDAKGPDKGAMPGHYEWKVKASPPVETTYTATATFKDGSGQDTVIFYPSGDCLLSWTIEPSEAKWGTTATGTLVAKKSDGTPCDGTPSLGTITPPGLTVVTPLTPDPAHPGEYTAEFTAKPETTTTYDVPATWTPSDGGAPTPLPGSVTFINDCDPGSGMTITNLDGSPVIKPVEPGKSYLVTAILKNYADLPCPVATDVKFSDTPAAANGTDATFPDGDTCKSAPATGTCSVTVTAAQPGTADIHASIPDPMNNNTPTELGGGVPPDATKKSPQPATWAMCVPDPSMSTFEVTPNNEASDPKGIPVLQPGANPADTAASTYTAKVTVRDADGAECAVTSGVTIAVDAADQVNGQPVVGTLTRTGSTVTAPVTSTVSDITFPIHGRIDGKDIEGKDPVTKVADPNKASPQNRTWYLDCSPDSKVPLDATFSIEETSVKAGDTAHGTLTLTDKNGNKCPTNGGKTAIDPTKVTIASDPNSPVPVTLVPGTQPTVDPTKKGEVAVQLTADPPVTTPYDVTATYSDAYGPASGTDSVTFTVDKCNLGMSGMILTPPNAKPQAGDAYTVDVQLRNADATPCAVPTEVTFSSDPADPAKPITPTFSSLKCETGANGKCTTPVTVVSQDMGTALIHAKIPWPDPVTNVDVPTDVKGDAPPDKDPLDLEKASPQPASWGTCGDPATSLLDITPLGPQVTGDTVARSGYTLKVTVPNCPAGSATPSFEVGQRVPDNTGNPDIPGQPKLSKTTCTIGDGSTPDSDSCSVTVTSEEAGTFPLHGLLNNTDVGGGTDPTKKSPQNRQWDPDCGDGNLQVSFAIEETSLRAGETAHGTMEVKDQFGNKCLTDGGPHSVNPDYVTITSNPNSPAPVTIVSPPGKTMDPTKPGIILIPVTATPPATTDYEVTATYTNPGSTPASAKDNVTFTVCSAALSEMTLKPTDPTDTPPVLVGHTYDVTASLKDASGDTCKTATTVSFSDTPDAAKGTDATFNHDTCNTDPATGSCTVTVTAQNPGIANIHATILEKGAPAELGSGLTDPKKKSPQPAEWHNVCKDTSSLTVDPKEVSLGQTTTATIVAKDCDGRPVEKITQVEMNLGPTPDNTFSNYREDPAKPGTYTVNVLPPQVVGPHPVTAAPPGIDPANPLTDTVTVTDVSDRLSWYQARATSGHLPVWVKDTYTVTAYVRDTLDKPMSGMTVTFSSSSPEVTLAPTTCTTDVNGVCIAPVVASATNHKAGQYDIIAKVGGVTILPTTDRTKNGYDGSPGWQKTEGKYTFPDPPNIVFWGCQAIDPKSPFTATPRTQTVGAMVDLTIVAVDEFGNACVGLQPGDFTIIGHPTNPTTNPQIGPLDSTTFQVVNGPSGEPNKYMWKATSEKAGDFEFTADVKNPGDGKTTTLNDKPPVTFIPIPYCDVNTSVITVVKGTALADDKDKTNVHVVCHDKYDNVVPTGQAVATNIGTNNPQHPNPNTVTITNGEADLFWTSPTAGAYGTEITVTGISKIPGWQPTLTYVPTKAEPSHSDLVVTPTDPTAIAPIPAGTSYTATVTTRDKDDKLVPDTTVSFTISTQTDPQSGQPYTPTLSKATCITDSTGKCNITVTGNVPDVDFQLHATIEDPATGRQADVNNSPATLRWAKVTAETAELVVSPTTPQPVNSTFTLDVILKDKSSSPVTGQTVTFQAQSGVTFVDGKNTCVTGGNGRCVAPVKVTSDKAGSYWVSLPPDTAKQPPINSPQTIVFEDIVPCSAVVTVTRNSAPANGTDQDVVKVTVLNCADQPFEGATVTSNAPSPVETQKDPIAKTDASGSTQITYTSLVAGPYPTPITVSFNGTPLDPSKITGSPAQLIFTSGPCTEPVSWEVTPTGPLTVGDQAENTYTARAYLRDSVTKQLCAGGGVNFTMAQAPVKDATHPAGLQWSTNACTTNAQGWCEVTIWSTLQGAFAMTPKSYDSSFEPASKVLAWQAGAPCETPVDGVPDDQRCRIEIVKDNALVGQPNQVDIYLFDRYGNPDVNYIPGWASDPTVTLTEGQVVPATNDVGKTTIHPVSTGDLLPADCNKVAPECPVSHDVHVTVTDPVTRTAKDIIMTPMGSAVPELTKSSPAHLTWIMPQDIFKNSPPYITKVDGQDVTPGNEPSIKVTQPLIEGYVTSSAGNPAQEGDKVTVSEGGKNICEGTVTKDAKDVLVWSCTPTAPLAEGEHTITAIHTGPNGLPSEPSAEAKFIVDLTKPVIDVTKPKPNDWINNKTPWQITGTASDKDPVTGVQRPLVGAPVTVIDMGADGKTPGKVLCITTPITKADGSWVCDVAAGEPGPDGNYTLRATVVDKAGNVSDPKDVPYVIDREGPNVKIVTPAPGPNNQEPIPVTGTTDTPGVVHVDDGHGHTCDATVSTTTNAAGLYTWACDLSNVPQGPVTITASQTDPGGKEGHDSVDINHDTKTPPDPVIVTPPKDAHINDNTPTVSGTIADDSPDHPLDPGTVVVVQDKNDPTNECIATVQLSADGKTGTWSCDLPKPLPDGPNTVTAQAKDPAGNVSNKVERPFVVDTKTPPDPVIEHPADGSYVNAKMIDDKGMMTVSGTITGTPEHPLDPGTVVIVKDKNDPTNQCTATVVIAADGKSGTWDCKLKKPPEGWNTVTAQAKDPAGNLSNTVESRFFVDTIPPPISNPDTTDPKNIGVDTEPNAKIEIQNEDGKTICTTTADDKGHAVCPVTDPKDVPNPGDKIHIIATDPAGNQSAYDTNIVWVTLKPVLTRPDDLQQVIVGHAYQPGEKVHAWIDGVIDLGWATANDKGDVQFIYNAPDTDAFEQGGKPHTVVLRGDHSGPAKGTFLVTHVIPKTGADATTSLAGAAALATALGAGLILVAWRRRRQDEEAIPQHA